MNFLKGDGFDRSILYTHLGISGVSTLSSKAQGRGKYVFTTVVSLQSCLPLPSKYLPQHSSLSPHRSRSHSCCSQLTPANTTDTVLPLQTFTRSLLGICLLCGFKFGSFQIWSSSWMLLVWIFAMWCNTLNRGTKYLFSVAKSLLPLF